MNDHIFSEENVSEKECSGSSKLCNGSECGGGGGGGGF